MNNIITLENLAELLAKRNNIPVEQARQYIIDLRQSLTDQITAGTDGVYWPYVGKFSVTNAETGDVIFTADEPLAEAVNEPFSFFEPVALCAEAEELEENAGPTLAETENTAIITEPDSLDNTEKKDGDITVETVAEEPVSEAQTDSGVPSSPKEIPELQAAEEKPAPVVYQDQDDYYDETERHGMSPIVAYILGILSGMLLTCVAVYFLYPPLYTGDDDEYIFDETELPATQSEEATTTATEEPSATVVDKESATQPTTSTAAVTQSPQPESSQVRTDTVSSTYFLASMSRKYYGRMEFWVYIYKENESKLGHPDRIPAGTIVVIPDASKYGINANSQESIDDARKQAESIYKKYK